MLVEQEVKVVRVYNFIRFGWLKPEVVLVPSLLQSWRCCMCWGPRVTWNVGAVENGFAPSVWRYLGDAAEMHQKILEFFSWNGTFLCPLAHALKSVMRARGTSFEGCFVNQHKVCYWHYFLKFVYSLNGSAWHIHIVSSLFTDAVPVIIVIVTVIAVFKH